MLVIDKNLLPSNNKKIEDKVSELKTLEEELRNYKYFLYLYNIIGKGEDWGDIKDSEVLNFIKKENKKNGFKNKSNDMENLDFISKNMSIGISDFFKDDKILEFIKVLEQNFRIREKLLLDSDNLIDREIKTKNKVEDLDKERQEYTKKLENISKVFTRLKNKYSGISDIETIEDIIKDNISKKNGVKTEINNIKKTLENKKKEIEEKENQIITIKGDKISYVLDDSLVMDIITNLKKIASHNNSNGKNINNYLFNLIKDNITIDKRILNKILDDNNSIKGSTYNFNDLYNGADIIELLTIKNGTNIVKHLKKAFNKDLENAENKEDYKTVLEYLDDMDTYLKGLEEDNKNEMKYINLYISEYNKQIDYIKNNNKNISGLKELKKDIDKYNKELEEKNNNLEIFAEIIRELEELKNSIKTIASLKENIKKNEEKSRLAKKMLDDVKKEGDNNINRVVNIEMSITEFYSNNIEFLNNYKKENSEKIISKIKKMINITKNIGKAKMRLLGYKTINIFITIAILGILFFIIFYLKG